MAYHFPVTNFGNRVYVRQNPDASPYDLVSLKTFVRVMAYSIDGAEGSNEAYKEIIRKY